MPFSGTPLIGATSVAGTVTMNWGLEAKNILKQVPSFGRGMAIKGVERFAAKNKCQEIRDESMHLASKRIKNFGFDELRMAAWDKAREKLKNKHKKEVIGKIKTFLVERTAKNEGIVAKFQGYLKASGETVKKEPASKATPQNYEKTPDK